MATGLGFRYGSAKLEYEYNAIYLKVELSCNESNLIESNRIEAQRKLAPHPLCSCEASETRTAFTRTVEWNVERGRERREEKKKGERGGEEGREREEEEEEGRDKSNY